MTIKQLNKENKMYIEAQVFNGYINDAECDFIFKNISANVDLAIKFRNLSFKFDIVDQNKKFILKVLENLKKATNTIAII